MASVYVVSNDINKANNECNEHSWPDTTVSLDTDVHHADNCKVQYLKRLITMRTTQCIYHSAKVHDAISYHHFQFEHSSFLTCVACSLPSTCTTFFSYSSSFHAIVPSALSAFRTLIRSKTLIHSFTSISNCDYYLNSIYFVFVRSKGGCNPQDIEHVSIKIYKCVQFINNKQEMAYNNKV